MSDLSVTRTLVKSPPELWSELSEEERLAQHLDAFGHVSIKRLDHERTVAWEGERASGTVSIEPSGWGTKVTLTAALPHQPEPAAEPAPPPRRGFWTRLFSAPEPAAVEPVEAVESDEPVVVSLDPEAAQAVLDEVLDALGAAHHRPFSRG
jgi:hypothetical protein